MTSQDTTALVERLQDLTQAYPLDVFPEVEQHERDWLKIARPGLQDCIAASMARHLVPTLSEAATTITALEAEFAALRDASEKEIASLKLSISAWEDSARINRARAEAAEALLAKAVEVLRPFAAIAKSMDAYRATYLRFHPGEGTVDGMSDAELAELFAPSDQVCLTDGAMAQPVGVTWGHLRAARDLLSELEAGR